MKRKVQCFWLCQDCYTDLLDGRSMLDGILRMAQYGEVCISVSKIPTNCGYIRTSRAVELNLIEHHLLEEYPKDITTQVDTNQLIRDLVKAVRTGECPASDCKYCKEKWDTVARAEEYLKSLEVV